MEKVIESAGSASTTPQRSRAMVQPLGVIRVRFHLYQDPEVFIYIIRGA